MTAGHCMDGSGTDEWRETIYKGGTLVGRKTTYLYFRDEGNADLGLLREKTDEGYQGDFEPYVRHDGNRVPVRGESNNYEEDELRCVTGRRTGTVCGRIRNNSYPTTYDTVDLYGMVKFDVQIRCGDSGAPVYSYVGGYAYANGVLSGGGPQDKCPADGGSLDSGIYSKWGNIPDSWDVVLERVPADTSPCPPTCKLDDPQDDS